MDQRTKKERRLAREWRMKRIDRQGDIPECPSLEEIRSGIIRVPQPDVKSRDEREETNVSPSEELAPIIDDRELKTAKDISKEYETSITAEQAYRRLAELVSNDSNHDQVEIQEVPSLQTIKCTTKERISDIPQCPSIEDTSLSAHHIVSERDEAISRLGQLTYEVSDAMYLLHAEIMNAVQKYPTPAVLIGLTIVSFLVIIYLELSLAAIIELLVQATWPGTHGFLVVADGFAISLSSVLKRYDDLLRGAYCDFAELWCDNFHMMCANRCSFFAMALERTR